MHGPINRVRTGLLVFLLEKVSYFWKNNMEGWKHKKTTKQSLTLLGGFPTLNAIY